MNWRSFFSVALILLACCGGPLSEMLRLAEAPRGKAAAEASLQFTCFLNIPQAPAKDSESKKEAPATLVKVLSGDWDTACTTHLPMSDGETGEKFVPPQVALAPAPAWQQETPRTLNNDRIHTTAPARGPPAIS